jgi:uroporphyrinogen III methyltransferase/synthase
MSRGIVYLVGAGPGDPGLITVKGLRYIGSADAIVYDRLVDRRLLASARPDAEMIDVGKVPRSGKNRQEDINVLLVELAKQGKRVVRLKGGDPFIFGRGGEEAQVLRASSVPFEIVPGITSAIAAPAYAGIPLTHRKLASSFSVVTGNEDPTKPDSALQWNALTRQGGTLVVLMGWENLSAIVETLLQQGRPPETSVALVQWGTEPYQRTLTGTLADIVEKAASSGLTPPVVTVIGEVVSLRDELRWFDNRPLFGKRVLVTRTREQASSLSDLLTQRGAQPVELPTIEVQKLDDYSELDAALQRLGEYEWVIFTSVNAVQVVCEQVVALGLDARAFHAVRIGAIGPATASSLRERGIIADFVPESFVSESVVEGLKKEAMTGVRVLLPRADIARDALSNGLISLGATVDEITAYRTVTPEPSARLLKDILRDGVDIATFTSSSTVRNLVRLLSGDLKAFSGATIACIGPITADTAREMGLDVQIVAREHTIAGLVEAIEAYLSQEDTP